MFKELDKLIEQFDKQSKEVVSRDEFENWQNHMVTKVFMSEVKSKLIESMTERATDLPLDNGADRRLVETAAERTVLDSIVNWSPEIEEN